LIARNPGFIPGFFVGGKYSMEYVYESPDGGETVYRRRIGQPERELWSVSESLRQQEVWHARWAIWNNVLAAAEHNPVLQEALDRARVIYELSRND
jgi:hypothetical protein